MTRATSRFGQLFVWQSESEAALAETALNMHIDLPSSGLLFKWIDVSDHKIESSSLKVEDAKRNVDNAELFYGQTEEIFANPGNLFEDIEAAFIIKMFKNSDAGFFYVLTELRKQIGPLGPSLPRHGGRELHVPCHELRRARCRARRNRHPRRRAREAEDEEEAAPLISRNCAE